MAASSMNLRTRVSLHTILELGVIAMRISTLRCNLNVFDSVFDVYQNKQSPDEVTEYTVRNFTLRPRNYQTTGGFMTVKQIERRRYLWLTAQGQSSVKRSKKSDVINDLS
jgi:hypothetical protein